jgi:chorismate synthase
MRLSHGALGVLLIAAPALATPPERGVADRLVKDLPTPGQVDAAGTMVTRVLDALAEVKVGSVVANLDPDAAADPRRREETLGDIASRDDPDYREKMHRSVRKLGKNVNAIAAGLAVLAPALERSLGEMQDSLEDALDEARGRGD